MNKIPDKVRNILIAFGAIVVLTVFSTNFLIIHAYKTEKPKKSDVIIVLGCMLWGNSPSPDLRYRLDEALKVYNAGYAANIIVTGGKGDDKIMAESHMMNLWLVERGVPASAIFEENKSASTYENIKFAKTIMDAHGFKSAIIATSNYHIYRALRIAKSLGIEASGAPSPTASVMLSYQTREMLTVIRNFITNK